MWEDLNMKDKAAMIRVAVKNGVTNLEEIRDKYNKFEEGGPLKKWKALQNIDFEAIPDTTFTRDKTGAGSIEYFQAKYPQGITYPNGYHKEHPKPGKDVILYNPNENDEQDIRLDALHIMPKDATYDVLNTLYRNAARGTDVEWNAKQRYEEDIRKYGDTNIDPYESYFNNEADGLLRNMFIEGTTEYIKSKRYYPDKEQLAEWNKPILGYINEIRKYLETGERPQYILPEVVITPSENIKDKYNKFDVGGPTNANSTHNDDGFLGLNGEEWLDIGTSMIPIYGLYKDAKEFYNDPSWKNAGWLAVSSLFEIPFLKWLKAGKVSKAVKAADKAREATKKYEKAKKTVDRMREIPNINPSRIRKASERAGEANLNMLKTTREALQLKEAAKYYSLNPKLSIAGGVVADYIQELSNKYDDGGIKDSWKPWYWFTPKYEASSLEEAIMKAYNDGREGEDILYNDRAYKAVLSEEGLKKYYSKNPEKIPRQQRILNNDSPTKKDSEKIENNILNTQNKALEAAEKINRNADYYYIPYIYDKEIKIPGIGRVSENILDSIAINARRAGLDLQQAIGLAAEETKLGAIPGFSLEANKKAYKNKYGKEMSKEQQKALERAAHNSSFSRNHGGIYPQFLVNDHEWSSRGWEKREDLKKVLTNIASPLEHAFTLYKKGFYNTGDENHSYKVKKAGKEVMKTKAFKEWYKKYNKK